MVEKFSAFWVFYLVPCVPRISDGRGSGRMAKVYIRRLVEKDPLGQQRGHTGKTLGGAVRGRASSIRSATNSNLWHMVYQWMKRNFDVLPRFM